MNPYRQEPLKVAVATGVESTLTTNKLIRNTYTLLAVTLLFSAVMAGVSMAMNLSPMMSLGFTIGALVLVWFVLPRTANSAAGIGVVFGITGLLGMGLGPILSSYLGLPNGSEIVMTAMGTTAVMFFGLSAYVFTTRKDFSYMRGFLLTGLILAIVAMIANIFLQIPVLSLAISGAVAMIMSGLILYDTSRIVNGGETNYIMATVGLYLSIYNLFVALLHIVGAFNSDD